MIDTKAMVELKSRTHPTKRGRFGNPCCVKCGKEFIPVISEKESWVDCNCGRIFIRIDEQKASRGEKGGERKKEGGERK